MIAMEVLRWKILEVRRFSVTPLDRAVIYPDVRIMTQEDFPIDEDCEVQLADFMTAYDSAFFDSIFKIFPRCTKMSISNMRNPCILPRIDFAELARFPLATLSVSNIAGGLEGIEFLGGLKTLEIETTDDSIVDVTLISGLPIETLKLSGLFAGMESLELPRLRELKIDYSERHNILQLISPTTRLPEKFTLFHIGSHRLKLWKSPWDFDYEMTQKLFDRYPGLVFDTRGIYLHPSVNGVKEGDRDPEEDNH